jgi:hypothetical protein
MTEVALCSSANLLLTLHTSYKPFPCCLQVLVCRMTEEVVALGKCSCPSVATARLGDVEGVSEVAYKVRRI